MKKLLHICLLLCVAATVAAQENRKLLKVYDWKDLPQQFPNSQIISMDGMSVLKIENTNNTPLEISLFKITNSSIIKKIDSLSCDMKYVFSGYATDWGENIMNDNNGYGKQFPYRLELFRYSPSSALGGDEITNAQFYAMGGTSNWKRYRIAREGGWPILPQSPTQLELKLYLQGNGTIYLRPIKLLGVVGSWWSPQQIGLIGGIGGSVIGCFGALLGLLASKGKARNFVLTTMKIFIALGILLTIAGFVAVVSNQPYAVWYALLLPGVILTLVFSLNLPSIQRRYDELEIRRMTSIDTMGG
jgi:hypothetical protein